MNDQPQSSSTTPPPQNSAVLRCATAWQRTYDLVSLQPKKERTKTENYDQFAEEHAEAAFRDAMPPLDGQRNIQDFIACTSYALLHNIFLPDDCERLLNCAKIALAAHRSQPRSGSDVSA